LGLPPSRTASAASSSHPSSREGDNEDEDEEDGGGGGSPASAHGGGRHVHSVDSGYAGNGLLSVLGGHGGVRNGNGKVNGDVTPRAFLNGRCHLANRGDVDVPPVIEATSSVATIRGLESSGPSVHASTHQSVNVKPRANRELVPFEADSELWPYPLTQAHAGVAGGQHQEEEHHDSGDEDADIVELDFEDTSVLSDLDAFKRAARAQRGLASRRDAKEESSHRVVAAASSPSLGLGEREKGKGKKKTRRERDARERDAIEKSWDVPDFCALQKRGEGVVQQDRQGQEQQQPQQVKTTTRYLTQAVTSPPASPSPPLPDYTPQMPVYTPQISVHTPQMPVHTPPRSVHTPQMPVYTPPPRSVHTPQIPVFIRLQGRSIRPKCQCIRPKCQCIRLLQGRPIRPKCAFRHLQDWPPYSLGACPYSLTEENTLVGHDDAYYVWQDQWGWWEGEETCSFEWVGCQG
jgi:hypothetical protein